MFRSTVKKSSSPALFALVSTLLLAIGAAPVTAQGNLLINPGRVMLSGSTRSAELTLVNTGETAITYRLELVDQRMTEAGGLLEIAEPTPADRSARSMIRYAPRQITLAGGGRQTVRLFLRKPAGLEPGEYRSHLRLRALPPTSSSDDVEARGKDDKLSFQLTLVPSLSIPVIVRHGEIERRADLSQARLAPASGDEPPSVAIRLHRAGNSSIYGELSAVWIPDRGPETLVSRLGGVAIYPPIDQLDYRLPLRLPEGEALTGGRFQVRFASHPVLDRGAPPVSAEAGFDLR